MRHMTSDHSRNNGASTGASTGSQGGDLADQMERAARALLDARMASVRALASSRHHVSELREQLAEAEREDVRTYNAALRDGWTADELKKLGLDEPDKKTRSRRTKTPTASASGTTGGGRTRSATADSTGAEGVHAESSESLQTV